MTLLRYMPLTLLLTCYTSVAGELTGSEAERELLYPNVVPPVVEIGRYGGGKGQFLDIRDVIFSDSETFFIADCATDRVQRFNLTGSVTGTVNIDCPTNLASDNSRLVVLNDRSGEITVLSTDTLTQVARWVDESKEPAAIAVVGGQVASFPRHGGGASLYDWTGQLIAQPEAPFMSRVSDITAIGDQLFVVDTYGPSIWHAAAPLWQWSQFGEYGTFEGEMANPFGITAGGNELTVADTVNHRIQQFTTDGQFQLQWGRHPISPQQMTQGRMHYPHNVAMSPDGNLVAQCAPYEARCGLFRMADIRRVYSAEDDSAYWNKFFWFHYRGPSRPVQFSFPRNPLDADYLLMGEEDIHRIVVSKMKDGVPQTTTYFGEFGSGPGQFKGPEGVFPGRNNLIYVVDTGNNRVQAFDYEGDFKFQFGEFGVGPGQFNEPGQGSVDLDGNLYISDSGNQKIHVFDEKGKLIREWGSRGTGPGEFLRPIDAFVDNKNARVLVTDLYNARVEVFDLYGKFLFEFGTAGTDVGEFISPHSAIYDETTDSIFVSDMTANNIQKFSSQGTFEARFGTYGIALGEFKTPAGIAVLDGKLIVMDHTNHRGQVLDPNTGTALLAFGESVIGVPTDVLKAKEGILELQQMITDLEKGGPNLDTELAPLKKRLDDLQLELDSPAILHQGHH